MSRFNADSAELDLRTTGMGEARAQPQTLFFKAATGNALTMVRAGFAFTVCILPKISFWQAFVAGLTRVLILQRPCEGPNKFILARPGPDPRTGRGSGPGASRGPGPSSAGPEARGGAPGRARGGPGPGPTRNSGLYPERGPDPGPSPARSPAPGPARSPAHGSGPGPAHGPALSCPNTIRPIRYLENNISPHRFGPQVVRLRSPKLTMSAPHGETGPGKPCRRVPRPCFPKTTPKFADSCF